jgi:hypothetical protein
MGKEFSMKFWIVAGVMLLASCSNDGTTPGSPAGANSAEDLVEFVAWIEATGELEEDPAGFSSVSYLESMEARFYRLDAPTSAAQIIDQSGVNWRGCTGLDSVPTRPWSVFTELPLAGMTPVLAGENITATADGSSWAELTIENEQGELVYTARAVRPWTAYFEPPPPAQVTLDVPGAEFPPLASIGMPIRRGSRSPTSWSRDLQSCLNCSAATNSYWYRPYQAHYVGSIEENAIGKAQQILRFESPVQRDIAPETAPVVLCRTDDMDPAVVPEEEALKPSVVRPYHQMYTSHSGVITERHGNVLLLATFGDLGIARQAVTGEP